MSLVTVEVIDAVQRTLEKEGLLQSIRAQLRSNVMKVLTSDLTKNTVHPNVKFAGTSNGRIVLSLVRELLLQLDMRQTLAVFDAESTVENFYDDYYLQMCSTLRLKERKGVSLLEQVVEDRIHQKPIFGRDESSSRKQSPPRIQPVVSSSSTDFPSTHNHLRRRRSPTPSPPSSPQTSPHVPSSLKNSAESKTFHDDSFDDEGSKESFEPSPKAIPSYGIKDNLEDLIESMSPQKDESKDTRENFIDDKGHSITPGNVLDIKTSPPSSKTQKKMAADDSMLDEIDEIIDSFEAEKEEEDEYDFNIPSVSSSPPKPALLKQVSPPNKKNYFSQDSSEEDDDELPPYGYVADSTKASALPNLPPAKSSVGRLPFNASDFIEDSKSDHGEDNGGDESFAESPKLDLKKPLAPILASTNKAMSFFDRADSKPDISDAPEIEDEVEEDFDHQSGPEYDSGEQDDGDFSQIDHFLTDTKDQVKNSDEPARRNVVQVQSSLRNLEHDDDQQASGRAQVSRTQGSSMRSTKGWDIGASDFRDEEDEEEEIDHLSSSPVGRIPIPGTGNRRNENRLDDMESSQLSIEDHQDEKHDDDNNVMYSSYRSNQEEEDDFRESRHLDDNEEFLIDHDAEEEKMHPEEQHQGDDEYEDEYDNDFADADQSALDQPVKAFTKVSGPQSSSGNNRVTNDNEDDYGDDYGEDGFEDDENNDKPQDIISYNRPSINQSVGNNANSNVNKRYASADDGESVEEEIESEIEDEDADDGNENGDGMSVGGASESDDDNGWGSKSKAKNSNEPTASSMFKQRSGVLPTVNNLNNNRPTFSSLNNFSDDDDDDDGLGAFSVSNRSSVATSQPNPRFGATSFSSNNTRSTSNNRFGDGSEENSVVSENLSVGGDNSGEESFSMND